MKATPDPPVAVPPAQPDSSPRAAAGDLTRYAAGSLGMGVWVTVPGLLLLYFLTNTLGVPPFLAGLTLLVPKILDVIVHPLLGALSDRQARRDGHRRGLLRLGLLLGAAMIAMFTVPDGLSGAPAAIWVGVWFVTGNLLFASFQVPYLATPSDLPIGYHERTRVLMFRMLFLTLGLLGAGVAAPALVSSAADRDGYSRMAVVLAASMALTCVVAVAGVRRLTDRCGFRIPDERPRSAATGTSIVWRDRDFRALVLSYLFTGTTTHLFLAAVPFYTAYVLGNGRLTPVFMAGFLAPAVVAGPGWMWVSRRIGKQRGLLLSQGIFMGGALALLAGRTVGPFATLGLIVAMGVAFAGLQLLAFSMVPDAVAAAEARGSAHAGAYTGMWTAADASASALGPYVYAAILSLGGFVATTQGHPTAQSHSTLTAMLLGFCVVPAALMGVALAFQRRCALDRQAVR
ncbi:MFS transporter [Streptomyces sp. NPDC055103]